MCYSLWYNAPTILAAGSLEVEELFLRFQATGRQHRGCLVPQAVTQSSAPEDGRNHRPKHVQLIGIINKPSFLHLVWLSILFTTKVKLNNKTDSDISKLEGRGKAK